MKFPHNVIHNGTFYPTGAEVPVEIDKKPEPKPEPEVSVVNEPEAAQEPVIRKKPGRPKK